MDRATMMELLSATKASDFKPNTALNRAPSELGVPSINGNDDVLKAQKRLVNAMSAVQEAAGGPRDLLRAKDLGNAALRVGGVLPNEELLKIIESDGNKIKGWSFESAKDGTLKAVGHAEFDSATMLSREKIAKQVGNVFEGKFGVDILNRTLENTAKGIANHASYNGGESARIANQGWNSSPAGAKINERTLLTQTARDEVVHAIKNGVLVSAKNALENSSVKVATEIAAKAGAKALAKTTPIVGFGVVLADVAGAGKDAYASTMDGRYGDAAIDGTRAVLKTAFGVGTQAANVTLVGGVAVSTLGETVDVGLQQLKSGSGQTKALVNTYQAGIRNADVLNQPEHQAVLQSKPELLNAIGSYYATANKVANSPNFNEAERKEVMAHVERNAVNLINEGRLSEFKPVKGLAQNTNVTTPMYELSPN